MYATILIPLLTSVIILTSRITWCRGGTSTDVSRYDGVYEHVFESTTAGIYAEH